MKKPVPKSKTELELKKWCIEQANNWKWESENTYQNTLGGGSRGMAEPDIIKRAQQIYEWVKK